MQTNWVAPLNENLDIVLSLYQDLTNKNYQNIRSGLFGEISPEKIYCEAAEMFFCPDLYAENNGVPLLFQVENEDSLNLSLTRAEIESLLSFAKEKGGYFYLVVPDKAKATAEVVLRGIAGYDCHKTFVLPV